MRDAKAEVEWRIERFDAVSSTNDLIREKGTRGCAEGAVVIASEQVAGRGRRGRTWHSPKGNLYLSFLLRPPRDHAITTLGLLIGLALIEACEAGVQEELDLALKWPNDVLLGNAKLAGILIEHEISGPHAPYVIVGCGVNIAHHPDFPDYPTTSLREHGVHIAPEAVAGEFIRALGRRYREWRESGFAAIKENYLARAWRLGQDMCVERGRERIAGKYVALGEDGALIVQTPSGTRRVNHGEFVSVPLARQPKPCLA